MNLAETLYKMMQDSMKAGQLADFVSGTVTSEAPLEITCDATMQVLRASVLILTEPVVEKKIPVLAHKHKIPAGTLTHQHADPVSGSTGPALTGEYLTADSLLSEGADLSLQGENIVCQENGQPLPIEDGYIILNRKLEQGDKVIMLRVNAGQRFIVLSRVFEQEG